MHPSHDGALPVWHQISTYLGDNGQVATVGDATVFSKILANERFNVHAAVTAIPQDIWLSLHRRLGHIHKAQATPSAIGRILSQTVADVSGIDLTVGGGILRSSINRSAAEKSASSEFTALNARPGVSDRTWIYLGSVEQVSPVFQSGGFLIKDVRVGLVPPK